MSDHNANRSLILILAGGCDHSPITEFFGNALVLVRLCCHDIYAILAKLEHFLLGT